MRDSELLKRPDYTKLSDLYRKYFSLGSLGESINLKFALISLLGYMVNSMKKKKPGTTYYEVTAKLAEKQVLMKIQYKLLLSSLKIFHMDVPISQHLACNQKICQQK